MMRVDHHKPPGLYHCKAHHADYVDGVAHSYALEGRRMSPGQLVPCGVEDAIDEGERDNCRQEREDHE